MTDRDLSQPHFQAEIVGDLSAKTALYEIGVEIDDVHREGRIARRVGFVAAIFDEQFARTGAEPCMHAILRPLVACAPGTAARDLVVIALLAAGDHAQSPTCVGNADSAACGIAVVHAAVLGRDMAMRFEIAALAKARFDQHGIDRTGEPRPFRHRRDPAGKLDPFEQDRWGIMHRRVHRIGTAAGEALTVDLADHALSRKAAIG